MALINRIEVAGYQDSRCRLTSRGKEENWSPEFVNMVLNLQGDTSMIVGTNGLGKTGLIKCVLALLSRSEIMTTHANSRMAPKSFGFYSHIRIEIVDVEWTQQRSLIPTKAGKKIVLGMYGNYKIASSSGNVYFYYYKGTLEDCPVAYKNGSRIEIINNDVFDSALDKIIKKTEGKRGSTAKEWKNFVGRYFELKLINQIVKYQIAGGAEGQKSLINVIKTAGDRRYDQELFYQYVAPEFIPDAMGEMGSTDQENFEQAVTKSLRGLFDARYSANQKKQYLDEVDGNLRVLSGISEVSSQLIDARNEKNKARKKFTEAFSSLHFLVCASGLPGMPPTKLPVDSKALEIIHSGGLVLQDGEVYIMDRILAEIIDEEAKTTNQRAQEKVAPSKDCRLTEVIEIPVDLDNRSRAEDARNAGSGHPNKLYTLDNAVKILDTVQKNFKPGWTKDTAINAVKTVFAWADTSALRQQIKDWRIAREDEKKAADKALSEIERLKKEQQGLAAELKNINITGQAFNAMEECGLFTTEECRSPLKTKHDLEADIKKVDENVKINNREIYAREEGKRALENFQLKGMGISAGKYIAEREKLREDLSDQITEQEDARTSLQVRRREAHSEHIEASEEHKRFNALKLKLEKLAESAPAYAEIFGAEPTEDLAKKVEIEYRENEEAITNYKGQIASKESLSKALSDFRVKHQSISPRQWLDNATAEKAVLAEQKATVKNKLDDLRIKKKYADKFGIAPEANFRTALGLAGGDVRPLSEAIKSFGFDKTKERDVLSVFAALLFAPVYSTPEDAIKAAREIDAGKLDCPVFVLPELKEFCANMQPSTIADGRHAILAGFVSDRVEGVIDPRTIENRRTELAKEIEVEEARFADICDELSKYDSKEHEDAVTTATLALKAIGDNVDGEIETLRVELSKSVDKRRRLEVRFEYRHLIKEYSDFHALGGTEKAAATLELFQTTERKLAEILKEISLIEQADSKVQERLSVLNAEIKEMESTAQIEQIAKKALEFLDQLGGEADLSAKVAEGVRLKNTSELLQKKLNFYPVFTAPFEAANVFVTNNGVAKRDTLAKEISDIEDQIILNEKLCKTHHEALEAILKKLDFCTEVSTQYHNNIMQVIKKYRVAKSRAAGIGVNEIDPTASDESVLALVTTIIDSSDDYDKWLSELQNILAILNDSRFDVLELANEYRDISKGENDLTGSFLTGIADLIDPRDGYDRSSMPNIIGTQLEQARKENDGRGAPELVADIYAEFQATFAKAKRDYEVANGALDQCRTSFSSDMTNLTIMLKENFKICKKALAPYDTGAGFIIKARLADEEARKNIIENIVLELEQKYGPKPNNGEKQQKSISELNQENTKMMEAIKMKFYQQAFSDVAIEVQFPGINGGAPMLFPEQHVNSDDKPSEGEEEAIMLLWIVKFGDFIIKRGDTMEAISADRNKKKRISAAIDHQRRRHRVYIIDGIFAKLSNQDYIRTALSPIKEVAGRFQLIGLMHNFDIKTDFSIFPTRISLGKTKKGVLLAEHQFEDGTIIPMHVHSRDN